MYGNKVESANRVLAGASVLTAAGGTIAELTGYGEKAIMKLINYVNKGLSFDSVRAIYKKEKERNNNEKQK